MSCKNLWRKNDQDFLHKPAAHQSHSVTFPLLEHKTHTHTSYSLVAAHRGVCSRVAQGSAEVLVHDGTDVSLEVGEEDAARAQVLGSWRQLLILLFDWQVARGGKPTAAILGVLHFGIQGQFLRGTRRFTLMCCELY